MDQVVEFMRDFIKAEHATQLVLYTESDETVLLAKLDQLEAFYAPGVEPSVKAPVARDAAYFEQAKKSLATVQPRVLFQIKHYKHPKMGDLYRCYLSENIRAGDKASYFANLYVADRKGQLQIVSQYLICLDCDGTGRIDGKRCPECKGKGWDYFYGVRIANPGELIEVRKLHKPDNPQQLAEYEAE
ncbi:MAG: hypothetical protein M3Z04_10985 [Chloroflexota bacterium]|nr:hypothetical protein [Chloroflexota bacterium]